MSHPSPQETGCYTIRLPDAGRTTGVLSMLSSNYDIIYDDKADVYRVYDSRQGPSKDAVRTIRGP